MPKFLAIRYFSYSLLIQCHTGADLQINLDSLLIQLKGKVSSKWYQFGEAAGIDKRVLDNYVKNCSPDECIVEMFDYWLRSYKGKMTWRVVAAILRSINLQQLAFDIEQVYVTGKLYNIILAFLRKVVPGFRRLCTLNLINNILQNINYDYNNRKFERKNVSLQQDLNPLHSVSPSHSIFVANHNLAPII